MSIGDDLFFISMAAELLGMHPQTLRKYERLGLIQPTRTIGSMRVYSRDELERLRLIKHFVDEAGVNLAGVQRLLAIADVVRDMQSVTDGEQSPRSQLRRLSDDLRSPDHPSGALSGMDFKDYYATLGLTKTATDKEIKQAFRKLARKYHPDVNPGDKAAEARFKEINEANEVLSDADKRRKYDELGANWRAYENVPPGAQGFPGGFSGFGGFQGRGAGTYTTGSGGQYRTVSPEEMEELLGGERRRLLRLLHDVLRRRRRGQRRRAADARAQPQPAPAPISSTPCSSRSRRRTTARCAGSR